MKGYYLMKSNILIIAGTGSIITAVFQTVISFSPSMSLYFGAPKDLVEYNLLLIISGLLFSIVFLVFGLYGYSGGGLIMKLPFLRAGLFVIGIIYSLRGIILFKQLSVVLKIFPSEEIIAPQLFLTSFVSLLIGILYLSGSIKYREKLK